VVEKRHDQEEQQHRRKGQTEHAIGAGEKDSGADIDDARSVSVAGGY
jgi:hypothetical protein